MLGAELASDPKIKAVPLINYYNFSLVNTSMQSLYDIPLSNDDYTISMS